MPFVDFPQSEFSKNKDKVKSMPRAKRVLRIVRKQAKKYTVPLLADEGRNLAGTKLTKTQVKNVQKRRAQTSKKNKKMVKQIWRKLF